VTTTGLKVVFVRVSAGSSEPEADPEGSIPAISPLIHAKPVPVVRLRGE
jgi:hypothetical protein